LESLVLELHLDEVLHAGEGEKREMAQRRRKGSAKRLQRAQQSKSNPRISVQVTYRICSVLYTMNSSYSSDESLIEL